MWPFSSFDDKFKRLDKNVRDGFGIVRQDTDNLKQWVMYLNGQISRPEENTDRYDERLAALERKVSSMRRAHEMIISELSHLRSDKSVVDHVIKQVIEKTGRISHEELQALLVDYLELCTLPELSLSIHRLELKKTFFHGQKYYSGVISTVRKDI